MPNKFYVYAPGAAAPLHPEGFESIADAAMGTRTTVEGTAIVLGGETPPAPRRSATTDIMAVWTSGDWSLTSYADGVADSPAEERTLTAKATADRLDGLPPEHRLAVLAHIATLLLAPGGIRRAERRMAWERLSSELLRRAEEA